MQERRQALTLSDLLLVGVFVALALLLWQLRGLIAIVAIAVVLAASIAPIVDWAQRWHVPRWLAVLLVYLGLLLGLLGAGLLIGPQVVEQVELLIGQVSVSVRSLVLALQDWSMSLNDTRPELFSQLSNQLVDVQALVSWTLRNGQQLLVRSFGVTTGLIGTVLGIVLALFISGYMVADSTNLARGIIRLLPAPWDDRIAAQLGPAAERMGGYIRGRILVSAILGIVITVTLGFLGLNKFALGLGAIAGVTNLIPFVGPVLGAIPALAVSISQGWFTVLWVTILYVVVQNLETYVLDPLLVGSSVGIHPLYQLLAVLGGTQVLGIIGALIVPPWVAGASVFLDSLYLQPKLAAERDRQTDADTATIGTSCD